MSVRPLLAATGLVAATLVATPAAEALTRPSSEASAVQSHPAAAVGPEPGWVDDVRDATRRFKKVSTAEAAGYGEFPDAAGVTCIEHHDDGGMGVHYVHGTRVGDDRIRARKPGALVYEPTHSGKLRLVAVEYIVFKALWRESHPTGRPTLKGHRFNLVPAGNRYGIPAFYELHLWAWKDNSAGLFADYNPDVHCPCHHEP